MKHKIGDTVHLSGVFHGKIGTIVSEGRHYGVKVHGYDYKPGSIDHHKFSEFGLRTISQGPGPAPKPEVKAAFRPFALHGSLPEGLLTSEEAGNLTIGCIHLSVSEVKQILQDLLVDGKESRGHFVSRKAGIQFGANWITWEAAKQLKETLDKVS